MSAIRMFTLTVLVSASLFAVTPHAANLPQGIIQQTPRPAPALQLSDMDGNRIDLRGLRGHWVFVHFWASWCGPCRREMPLLQQLPKQLDQQRFAMLLVNTSEDEDTVFTFLASVAPSLNAYLDRDGRVTEAWQPRGLPATYLVDPQGRIRYQALGGRPWDAPEYLGFLKELISGP